MFWERWKRKIYWPNSALAKERPNPRAMHRVPSEQQTQRGNEHAESVKPYQSVAAVRPKSSMPRNTESKPCAGSNPAAGRRFQRGPPRRDAGRRRSRHQSEMTDARRPNLIYDHLYFYDLWISRDKEIAGLFTNLRIECPCGYGVVARMQTDAQGADVSGGFVFRERGRRLRTPTCTSHHPHRYTHVCSLFMT